MVAEIEEGGMLFVPHGWFYEVWAEETCELGWTGWYSWSWVEPVMEAALAQLRAFQMAQARVMAVLPPGIRQQAAAEAQAAAAVLVSELGSPDHKGKGKERSPMKGNETLVQQGGREVLGTRSKWLKRTSQLCHYNRRQNSCSVNPLHARLSCLECAAFWKQAECGGLAEDDDMRVYCINLDRRPDRWTGLEKELTKLRAFAGEEGEGELQVERVSAVDGRTLELPVPEVAPDWDNTRFANLWADMQQGEVRSLTPGEVGCALSHVEVWRRVAQSTSDTPALVLEDDVILEPDVGLRLPGYLSQLPPQWELVYLGGLKIGRHKRISPNLIVPECYLCTHAYMISKSGARKLLDQLPVTGPVDHFMSEQFRSLLAYAMVPALAHQPQHFAATVESEDSDVVHTMTRVKVASGPK
eukprot:TRINITY_DN3249_c0_g2_i3.p1 TRINITY_DN3249_c0_g2~~TRINITY_DN3249_c0_g2_i3.p1  ORF type:complete len:413 (-),score=76.32 TRINITY_DN3249_c0_g2_i3:97-1335(-)